MKENRRNIGTVTSAIYDLLYTQNIQVYIFFLHEKKNKKKYNCNRF